MRASFALRAVAAVAISAAALPAQQVAYATPSATAATVAAAVTAPIRTTRLKDKR